VLPKGVFRWGFAHNSCNQKEKTLLTEEIESKKKKRLKGRVEFY